MRPPLEFVQVEDLQYKLTVLGIHYLYPESSLTAISALSARKKVVLRAIHNQGSVRSAVEIQSTIFGTVRSEVSPVGTTQTFSP